MKRGRRWRRGALRPRREKGGGGAGPSVESSGLFPGGSLQKQQVQLKQIQFLILKEACKHTVWSPIRLRVKLREGERDVGIGGGGCIGREE